jgi:hypothetical protein
MLTKFHSYVTGGRGGTGVRRYKQENILRITDHHKGVLTEGGGGLGSIYPLPGVCEGGGECC